LKELRGEEETGRRRLDGELEGDNPTLRFDFTRVREGGAWHGGAPKEGAAARASEGGRRPPGGPTWARGRRALTGKGILTGKI
jgi:hypothetical protein